MFLKLENISYSYLGSGYAVFSDLSLSFTEGWTVIAGANGTGKSTLISIAAGLIIPDSGCVKKSGDVILCPQVFTGLAPEDWSDIFSGDNYVGMLKSSLSLTDEMIEREDSLSGGEKKRLQLLAALSHSPEILILDEPTNHLDVYSKQLIVNALNTFKGIGIIVSHDRTFASALSSRTILLDRGTSEAASIEDIPLPLPEALDESDRRKKSGRNAYDSLLSAISAENSIVRSLSTSFVESFTYKKCFSRSSLCTGYSATFKTVPAPAFTEYSRVSFFVPEKSLIFTESSASCSWRVSLIR